MHSQRHHSAEAEVRDVNGKPDIAAGLESTAGKLEG
jgi:hypothetical protein